MTANFKNDAAGATWWVVMGVSGCGKSSLGSAMAQEMGLPLIEGDDFHPPANIEKMHNGIALDDADRAGWLHALGIALAAHEQGAVLTCSALKRAYRDTLRAAVPQLRFVFMEISPAQALARVEQRKGSHFFSSSLVDSQFATLQDPTGEAGVLPVPAAEPVTDLVRRVHAWRMSLAA
ncbi:gluconokinase [Xylophilus sp. GOD-11R]|uniref:gluconokinase n=1 Tax=Xylophilus sp. GOD-11R TaxID=3089814 RepID=UPI00298C6B0D|nr:gluconokinase [Xylophilus sp. GOD-11R]WPB59185.1 gluconokinase [Xylophilus sp. GOD-11R]